MPQTKASRAKMAASPDCLTNPQARAFVALHPIGWHTAASIREHEKTLKALVRKGLAQTTKVMGRAGVELDGYRLSELGKKKAGQ